MLRAKLPALGISLDSITQDKRLVEMSFLFPTHALSAAKLSALIAREDPLSGRGGAFTFANLSGLFKGFIDLVFDHQGKYYVLDWKSNYLGDQDADYHPEALEAAMLSHRYDLQYQIYAYALQRYLKTRLPDYDYDVHFGGVYYVFLRGAQAGSEQGIFYTKPSQALLEGLDEVFNQ